MERCAIHRWIEIRSAAGRSAGFIVGRGWHTESSGLCSPTPFFGGSDGVTAWVGISEAAPTTISLETALDVPSGAVSDLSNRLQTSVKSFKVFAYWRGDSCLATSSNIWTMKWIVVASLHSFERGSHTLWTDTSNLKWWPAVFGHFVLILIFVVSVYGLNYIVVYKIGRRILHTNVRFERNCSSCSWFMFQLIFCA